MMSTLLSAVRKRGLIPSMRRLLWGEAHPPKAKRYGETATPTTSSYYEGMHRYYRWFRQDSYTRKCILTNAYFATMTTGFETALEPTGDDVDLEDYATSRRTSMSTTIE